MKKPIPTALSLATGPVALLLALLIGAQTYQERRLFRFEMLAKPGASYRNIREIYGAPNSGEDVRRMFPDSKPDAHGHDFVVPPESVQIDTYSFFGGAYCYVLVDANDKILGAYWHFT